MRISRKLTRSGEKLGIGSGLVSGSSDRRVSAGGTGGAGQYGIVSPGGMAYIPGANEDAVMLSDGNRQLCIGVRMIFNRFDIKPGELVLFTPAASVHLTNDGDIKIEGNVYINGQLLEVE